MLKRLLIILTIAVLVIATVDNKWHALFVTLRTFPFTLIKIIFWLSLFLLIWNTLLGAMKELGWQHAIASLLRPALYRIFSRRPNSAAIDAIALNVSANLMGMGNAATPAGLNAMKALQSDNPEPSRATDCMCLFLAINTSSVQLFPITAISILTAAGFTHAWGILIPTWIVTSATTIIAIIGAHGCAAAGQWIKIHFKRGRKRG